NMSTRRPLRHAAEVGLHQPRQADQNKNRAGDNSRGLQGQMVNHVRHSESVLWPTRSPLGSREVARTGLPYKLNPLAFCIRTSRISPMSFLAPWNTTILFARVRPINRPEFVLLGPSQRISTERPINRSPARRADSFTIRSRS